jgi:predicted DNA-binding protein
MPEDHKTLIRLPKELHTEARIKALREGKTLSAVVRELLTLWLEEAPEQKTSKEQMPKRRAKAK